METVSDTRQLKADLFSLGAVLCWSTVATAFKLSLKYLTPAQLILSASVVAWLFLGAILIWQGRMASTLSLFRTHKKDLLLMGFLNPALYYIILLYAYDLLPAQEAQAINYTWAITMSLLACPMLGHRLRAADLIAAAVCYAGVLVIATRGNVTGLQFASTMGVLLAFGSTVIWSVYWLLSVRDTRDPVAALWMNQSAGIVMIAIYCCFTGELFGLKLSGLGGAAYVGLVEMGLSFLFWSAATRLTLSTSRIANMIFLSPLLSLLFISSFLGEKILVSTLAGLGMIMVGLFIQRFFSRDSVGAGSDVSKAS